MIVPLRPAGKKPPVLAAAAGVIDRDRAIGESLLGIRRAGAEAILTYWALEVAGWLNAGRSLA